MKGHWASVLSMGLLISWVSVSSGNEKPEGISVLKEFTESEHAKKDEPVLGMVGFYGAPQPPQWLILTAVSGEPKVLREVVYARGKVVAERKFRRLPKQDLPSVPISISALRFDSTEAFAMAERLAVKKKISFDSVHFQLRCRDAESEPVWLLSLINPAQTAVGVLYISAKSGKLLKETWPTRAKHGESDSRGATPPITLSGR